MVSILMSTYNGEKYIEEQLISIYNQTVEVDEVVIVDDCSQDNTCKIIQNFIKEMHLENKWILYRNSQNIGWKKNFMQGLKKINGDIVFFSDQDDVWINTKIEIMLKVMDETKCNVISSNEIIWNGEKRKEIKIIDYTGKSITKNNYKNYLIHCSGCTMSIKMEYVRRVIDYYKDECAHDDFFWKISLIDKTLYKINEPLILHRIHGKNESRKKRNYDSTVANVKKELAVIDGLEEYVKKYYNSRTDKDNEFDFKMLNHKRKGFKIRRSLLEEKKIYLAIVLLFGYCDIYRHKKEIIKDVYLTIKNKRG